MSTAVRKNCARLRAIDEANAGNRVRTFTGEGDRQYLTGLKVGGKNILIAVDTSASMLDDDIVNVLRRRNMSDDRKRSAPKWQRAVRTVEWLVLAAPIGRQLPDLRVQRRHQRHAGTYARRLDRTRVRDASSNSALQALKQSRLRRKVRAWRSW